MPCMDHHQATMDPSIWSNLPQEMIERVLAKLPLISFLQLLSVSKQWRSFFHSNHFLHLLKHYPPSPPNPCFLFHLTLASTAHLLAYDPATARWCKLALSFLPPGVDAALVSVSRGLLCFKTRKSDSASYIICNPITKTYKELPPPLHYTSSFRSPSLQAVLVDEASSALKIIIAGYSTGRERATEVYSSRTRSWRLVGDLPLVDGCKIASIYPFSGQPVCEGKLYCRSHLPPGVIAFDLEHESWTDIRVSICPSVLSPYLVEHKGRVLMVGGVRGNGRKDFNPKHFCIWELHANDSQWIEVARMPDDICSMFLERNTFTKFRCTGKSGVIYFTSACVTSSLVMYNLSLKSWSWISDCNLKIGRKSLASFTPPLNWDRVFVYEPSLQPVN